MIIKIDMRPVATSGNYMTLYNADFVGEHPTLGEFVEWIVGECPDEWGVVKLHELGGMNLVEYYHGKVEKTCDDYEKMKGLKISLTKMESEFWRTDYIVEFEN